jgi:hypothetical protein
MNIEAKANEYRANLLARADVAMQVQVHTEIAVSSHRAKIRHNVTQLVIQTVCKHPPEFFKRHPDPSGNNDSWDQCIACGKEI